VRKGLSLKMLSSSTAIACVIGATVVCLAAAARPNPRRAQPITPVPPPLTVSGETRLLIIAPHPDDEILGAAGLMTAVSEAGGKVHVVYLTDGDGYPEGVRFEDRVEAPTPADYRGYGRERKAEARKAIGALRLRDYDLTFLSFPDGGLCQMIHQYWSERRAAYRSPYTRLNRPPRADIIVPATQYRGEDLTQELASLIGTFQPTLIVVPRKEDQHPDHCAAWFFLADALGDVQRVHPELTPDVVNYIIHYYGWPFQDSSRPLGPPPGLRGGISGWMRVPLTPAQVRLKQAALARYQTQMHVMSWFLEGFARSNEIFSRPAPFHVVLPFRRSPCCW
jgi:LmbE family N-acetylglucosaminyl deacetylase